MGFKLHIVFIFASIITLTFVIRKIRKHGLNIDDAIVWILWAVFLLILSLIPNLAYIISDLLGFMSTSNFIFTLFIFFLYIILFVQTTKISALKEKQKELIQKLSILQYEKEKQEKE